MTIGWKNAPQISWQDHGAFPSFDELELLYGGWGKNKHKDHISQVETEIGIELDNWKSYVSWNVTFIPSALFKTIKIQNHQRYNATYFCLFHTCNISTCVQWTGIKNNDWFLKCNKLGLSWAKLSHSWPKLIKVLIWWVVWLV